MVQQRIRKFSSWDSSLQKKNVPFAPQPDAIQAQHDSPSEEKVENTQNLERPLRFGRSLANSSAPALAEPASTAVQPQLVINLHRSNQPLQFAQSAIATPQTKDTNWVQRAFQARDRQSYQASPIQAKLTVGQPHDRYEQEADQVAQQVVQRLNTSMLRQSDQSPSVQSKALPNATADRNRQIQPLIQRRVGNDGLSTTSDLEGSINQSRNGGQSLPDNIREPMEQAFGADFSGVKIHVDPQADQLSQSLQAEAFTTRNDIFFRQGAYQPQSQQGQELLAHELTHVVQQNTGLRYGNTQEIQRNIYDEDGDLQEDDEVIEYLTEHKVDKEIAKNLVNAHQKGIWFRADLLALGQESNKSVLLKHAKEMIKQESDWWLERLDYYNYILYKDNNSVLAYMAEYIMVGKGNSGIIDENEKILSQNKEEEKLGMDRKTIITEFNRKKQKTSPAEKICDLVAQLLMVEAIGTLAYDAIKESYEHTFLEKSIKERRKNQPLKPQPDAVEPNSGGWARDYLVGEQDSLKSDLAGWSEKDNHSVMQVKFNGDGGAHTFVLERLGSGHFLMFQAYEGAISLKDFLTVNENNPLGQGIPFNQNSLKMMLFEPLASALSTGKNKTGIPAKTYSQVFGAKKDHPVAVYEVALVAFDIDKPRNDKQDSEELQAKKPFLGMATF